jgi:hypothetical protein
MISTETVQKKERIKIEFQIDEVTRKILDRLADELGQSSRHSLAKYWVYNAMRIHREQFNYNTRLDEIKRKVDRLIAITPTPRS